MRRSLASLMGLLFASGCFTDPPSGSSTDDGSSTSAAGTSSDPSTTAADTSTGADATTGDMADTSGGPGETTDSPGSSSSGGDTSETDGPTPMCPPGRPVLYVNFEGAVLTDSGLGLDNAPAGIVGNPDLAGEHGPYAEADRMMIFDLVRGHFESAGVCVADQVPTVADFDMIIVTSDTYQDNPNVLGLPFLDCGNAQLNNVNVVFLSEQVALGAPQRAIAISKFAGALYGLEDVSGNQDIMNRFVGTTSNGAMFTEVCLPLAEVPMCEPDPTCDVGQQSSLARLSEL